MLIESCDGLHLLDDGIWFYDVYVNCIHVLIIWRHDEIIIDDYFSCYLTE